jgi:hypothetical protein
LNLVNAENSGTILRCRKDRARIGISPNKVVWTGSLDRSPAEPDGKTYVRCGRCKKWQRFEEPPADAVTK